VEGLISGLLVLLALAPYPVGLALIGSYTLRRTLHLGRQDLQPWPQTAQLMLLNLLGWIGLLCLCSVPFRLLKPFYGYTAPLHGYGVFLGCVLLLVALYWLALTYALRPILRLSLGRCGHVAGSLLLYNLLLTCLCVPFLLPPV
jgi:hypothetical protein